MGDGEQSTLSYTQSKKWEARQKMSVRTKVDTTVWEVCLPDPH